MKNTTKTIGIICIILSLIGGTIALLILTGHLIIFEDGSFLLGRISYSGEEWSIAERWFSGCLPFNLCN